MKGDGPQGNQKPGILGGCRAEFLANTHAADVVFELTVESINGIKNHTTSGSGIRPADPDFLRVIQTLRKAQLSGYVGMRIQQDKEKKETILFSFHHENIDPALAATLAAIRN